MNEHYKYTMSINLNVLHHLGIKLYSNVPAVISEVVANSWDADAHNVDITIGKNFIEILDNGHGMTVKDANAKYLEIGYERREKEGGFTKEGRSVMGRKGIGKLSLFSIADTIEVYSIKDGEKHGLKMSARDIERTIKEKEKKEYHPEEVPCEKIGLDCEQGTLIKLTDLKKRTTRAVEGLRKRIARRFSILGDEYNFFVKVDGKPVTIEERDYFHKIEYIWQFNCNDYKELCNKHFLKESFSRPSSITVTEDKNNKTIKTKYKVRGWIGTVRSSGQLKDGTDNLSKIVVMVRGKLAQEDILEDFSEGGLYTKYLIGELHADFLDLDDHEDIATSNRQEIRKDDPRYIALGVWVGGELKHIESIWTELRNKEGKKEALKNPFIKEWFKSLPYKSRQRAEKLFGKINQLKVDSEDQKNELFRYSVLAFESLRYKDNLEALDALTPENIEALKDIFDNLDDIEATLYHQIVNERLQVIEVLQEHVADNALEKVIQQYLYDHLWLLDPSWDRATETPLLEKQVAAEFKKLDGKLSLEEKKARYDIKYKNPSGKHIIVELKRANRTVSSFDLAKQIRKYMSALKKLLKAAGRGGEPIEAISLVGRSCTGWEDLEVERQEKEMLEKSQIHVVLYQQLIENAYKTYRKFLEKKSEVGKIATLVRNI